MSYGPKNLTQWVATALSAVDKFKNDGTPAQCVGFSVNHVGGTIEGGGIEREIHAVAVGGKKFNDQSTAELSAVLHGAAETDAQNLTRFSAIRHLCAFRRSASRAAACAISSPCQWSHCQCARGLVDGAAHGRRAPRAANAP
jgi:type V secretory pathway adhesin AidA